ncbi:MAG: DNA polymerase III subunit gamma/tau, partial [Candidatus Saccharimonas sp.]|nr:DNA polymerase III subunit gamma/tau [Planctomycetaceae bacterium]
LIEIVEALIARDRSAALGCLDAALCQGVQLEAFSDQLVSYFRDLMVTACGANDAALLSVGTDQRGKLKEQADRWGLQTIVAAMQILAETKARMQRVTYGRALAELAMVRISLLEDLDQLDGLIAVLKAGQPVTLPATSATSRPQALPRTAPAPPALEKKNDVADQNEARIAPEPQPVPPSPPLPAAPPAPPVIEWKPGCENELHAAVIVRLTDMTGTYLRRVAATAISGPNILEFSFPVNYDLDRKACDRPEVIAQLERVISELVGQATKVRFRTLVAPAATASGLEVAESGPVSESVAVIAAGKSRFVELPEDPYLQDVMGVFGIKVWKVQTLAAETTSSGETPEPVEE